ncbi:hypothetical protein Tco_0590551 [Tanacetum coccineum]
MRTASTAAKPCQEDSSEFYLITDNIYTDQWGTMVFLMVAAARRGRVRFIAACSYSIDNYKDIMKAQVHESTSFLKRQSVKVKESQERRIIIKAFNSKTQEKYEHVGPKVTSTQDGKDYKMAKRDYAWLMISRSSRSHS